MNNDKYEKILREGEKTDWYGVDVPLELVTATVRLVASNISEEIDKLEASLDGLRGTDLDKRKRYIKSLKKNLQNIPYTLNGDFYLIKKKRYELELEEKNKTTKTTRKKRTTRKTTTSSKPTSKNTTTKNSDLIFGRNKK